VAVPDQFVLRKIQHAGCTSSITKLEKENDYTIIYPNPTIDIIRIESDKDIINIELYDINGQFLISENNLNSISLNYFEKGIYQLRITKSNHETIFKNSSSQGINLYFQ
jgi:hypothetical protein